MKSHILSAVAVVTAVGLASPAAAATTFAGGSQGCFAVSPSTTCVVGSSSIDSGLTYTGGTATFSQTTNANGFAAIGGPLNNFGTITLAPSGHDYGSDLFNLLVTFTLPAGAGSGSYTANLLGSLTAFGQGGVQISFQNPTQTLTSSAGSFILHVNDVSFSGLPVGEDVVLRQDISGFIQAVPEPATWGMMLLGFAGMGLAMRTRRRGITQLA